MKKKNYVIFVALWLIFVLLFPIIDIYFFRHLKLTQGESQSIIYTQCIFMFMWLMTLMIIILENKIKK